MSYESPIEIVATQFRVEREKALESEVFKAIHGLDITVHKEELIKALRYDRNQYDKGYKDGYDDGYDKRASELAREIFDEIEEVMRSLDGRYMASGNPKQSWGVRGAMTEIAELKKKYTEENDNDN